MDLKNARFHLSLPGIEKRRLLSKIGKYPLKCKRIFKKGTRIDIVLHLRQFSRYNLILCFVFLVWFGQFVGHLYSDEVVSRLFNYQLVAFLTGQRSDPREGH